MPKYKVIGDKVFDFYTIVTAASPINAWEYAANNDNLDWFQVETDRTIEPYDVQLIEDEIEDEYPSMDPGIIIQSDKSDI